MGRGIKDTETRGIDKRKRKCFMEEDTVKEEEDMANKTVENKETLSKIGR